MAKMRGRWHICGIDYATVLIWRFCHTASVLTGGQLIPLEAQ